MKNDNVNDSDKNIATYYDDYLQNKPFNANNLRRLDGDNYQLCCDFPLDYYGAKLRAKVATHLRLDAQRIILKSDIRAHRTANKQPPIAGVKNIIAVAAGKGGVGKSTTAVNLALALTRHGARVGLLDGDIYGPNLAHMLGGTSRPQSPDGVRIFPVLRCGMQTLSLADLTDDDEAIIWRAPLVNQTLLQLIHATIWQNLHYLIIDLPPGTGDTALTLAQQIPLCAVVLVTTPQKVATLDVVRAKTMFDKVRVTILGIIENMSGYICEHCKRNAAIFGSDGGKKLAAKMQLPLLGQIPLSLEIRAALDAGNAEALYIGDDNPLGAAYLQIALNIAVRLAQCGTTYRHNFANVSVEMPPR